MSEQNERSNQVIVSVTRKGYSTKEESNKYFTTADWEEVTVTPACLLLLFLSKGHVVTHLFNHEDVFFQRAGIMEEDNFRGSWVVYVDIDQTKYESMADFVDSLTITPTFGYYTFNDRPEARRFRLVYCLTREVKAEEYKQLYRFISHSIEADTDEKIKDGCGRILTQPFFGYNRANADEAYHTTYPMYSPEEIFANEEIVEEVAQIPEKEVVSQPESEGVGSKIDLLPKNFTNKYYFQTKDELKAELKEYAQTTERFYSAPVDKTRCRPFFFNGIYLKGYQLKEGEEFPKLPYYANTIKDGQRRRLKTFYNAALRRYIRPDVDATTLAVNMAWDLCNFVEFDKDINPKLIEKTINQVCQMTPEEIEKKYPKTVKAAKARRPKKGTVMLNYIKGVSPAARNKAFRKAVVLDVYDPSLSIEDNYKKAVEEENMSINFQTYMRYLQEGGITKKAYERNNTTTDEEILSMYDPTISFDKNVTAMAEAGVKVSKGRLVKVVNKYKDDMKKNQTQPEQNNTMFDPEDAAIAQNTPETAPESVSDALSTESGTTDHITEENGLKRESDACAGEGVGNEEEKLITTPPNYEAVLGMANPAVRQVVNVLKTLRTNVGRLDPGWEDYYIDLFLETANNLSKQ